MAKTLRSVGLALVLLLVACVSQPLQSPDLSLVSVGMITGDVFSQQFRVRLHVDNPNNRALSVKRLEYEIFLQGDAFADGTNEQPFVVPANGQTEFDLVVTTRFISSIGRLLSKLERTDLDQVEYAVIGNVQLTSGMVRKVPFKKQGVVALGLKK